MNEDTKRYVSLEQIARHKLQVTYPNDYHNGWNDAIDEILECQPADVQEVKHGEWVHLGGDEWCCSICGDVIFTEGSWEKPDKKYCNECGAKMDGAVESVIKKTREEEKWKKKRRFLSR